MSPELFSLFVNTRDNISKDTLNFVKNLNYTQNYFEETDKILKILEKSIEHNEKLAKTKKELKEHNFGEM